MVLLEFLKSQLWSPYYSTSFYYSKTCKLICCVLHVLRRLYFQECICLYNYWVYLHHRLLQLFFNFSVSLFVSSWPNLIVSTYHNYYSAIASNVNCYSLITSMSLNVSCYSPFSFSIHYNFPVIKFSW